MDCSGRRHPRVGNERPGHTECILGGLEERLDRILIAHVERMRERFAARGFNRGRGFGEAIDTPGADGDVPAADSERDGSRSTDTRRRRR